MAEADDSPTPAALFAALDATWAPAARVSLGDWIVRRGLDGGSRVSSVWPKGDPGIDLAAAIDAAAAIQRGWGQRPLVQIGPGDAALDAALAARGWEAYDACEMLAAPVARIAAHGAAGLMVVKVRAPLAALDALWAEGGVGPARRAVMARTPAPKEILLLRAQDRPAAALFVAAQGETAMLHALHVAPAQRRAGAGAAATAAAALWAQGLGARTLALAVTLANAPARALYRRLGFAPVCGYHYRRAPQETGQETTP